MCEVERKGYSRSFARLIVTPAEFLPLLMDFIVIDKYLMIWVQNITNPVVHLVGSA